ncbi:MAG: TMEM175 family protein [Bacteroidia bacterium]
MNKTRLEAFSDGVFAIVITLLILDIRLPEVDYSHLAEALKMIYPRILSYVMSFVVIGIYWISHHNSFQLVEKTNRVFLWMNIFLLLFISFIPFPTSLLGRYPFQTIPVMIYGINLLVANLWGFFMLLYVYRNPQLASALFTRESFKKQIPIYICVNSTYLFAILLSPFAPMISYFIYIFVIISLIFIRERKTGLAV